jgi:hypothetical protein
MFGRASSRPIQKLETDPGIAIVPCEALSKGTPELRKNHLPSLVGGNEQLVGENAIAFSCSEAGNSISLRGRRLPSAGTANGPETGRPRVPRSGAAFGP